MVKQTKQPDIWDDSGLRRGYSSVLFAYLVFFYYLTPTFHGGRSSKSLKSDFYCSGLKYLFIG